LTKLFVLNKLVCNIYQMYFYLCEIRCESENMLVGRTVSYTCIMYVIVAKTLLYLLAIK